MDQLQVGKNESEAYLLDQKLKDNRTEAVYFAHRGSIEGRFVVKVFKGGREFGHNEYCCLNALARQEDGDGGAVLDEIPDVVHLVDVGPLFEVSDGETRATDGWCIVTKHVEGPRLIEWLRSLGETLSWKEAAKLISRLGITVQAIHERGVVHRDIKPDNIIVRISDGEPHPVLIDFGSAIERDTVVQSDGSEGTVPWLSPEQARGDGGHFGETMDIYALGAILYLLLTGERPYMQLVFTQDAARMSEEEDRSWRRTICKEKPKPIDEVRQDVPQRLIDVCNRCIDKDPKRRFASVRELGSDLDWCLGGNWVERLASVTTIALYCVSFCLLHNFFVIAIFPDFPRPVSHFTDLVVGAPAVAAIVACIRYRHLRSARTMFRRVLFFCWLLSCVSWILGEAIWVIWEYQRVPVTEISWADPFYVLGDIARAMGACILLSYVAAEIGATLRLGMLGAVGGIPIAVAVAILQHVNVQDWRVLTVHGAFIGASALAAVAAVLALIGARNGTALPRRHIAAVLAASIVNLVCDCFYAISVTVPEAHPWAYREGGLIDFGFFVATMILSLVIVNFPFAPPPPRIGANRLTSTTVT